MFLYNVRSYLLIVKTTSTVLVAAIEAVLYVIFLNFEVTQSQHYPYLIFAGMLGMTNGMLDTLNHGNKLL